MGAARYLASRTRKLVLAVGGGLVLALTTAATPSVASEFFDDMQRIVEPRLQVVRGQRIRLMIRDLVEGRLRIDAHSGDRKDAGILGLGSVISPVADEMATTAGWGTWVNGNVTYLDSDDTGAEFDGPQASASAGLDYALTESILVGFSADFEHSNIRNNIGTFAPGREKTNTIGVGPYLGIALTDNLVFDASFQYSWSDHRITDTISRADFNSHAFDVTANLTAYVPLTETVTLAPTVGIAYSHSRDEAYTDNIGFTQPAQETDSGVLNFGAKLSYFHAIDDVRSIEPSFSVEGAWEFELSGDPPLGIGVASNANDPELDVTITGGADIVLSETVSLSLTSSVGGLLRKQYIEVSGGAQATVQF